MNVEQIKQDLGTKEMPDNLVYLIDAVRNIFAASNASYADGINVMIALLAEIGDNLEGGNARNDFKNMLMAAYELQVEHLVSQTNKTLN